MAMQSGELMEWLDTIGKRAIVGIDDDGLTLRALGSMEYIEVGGLPLGEPDDSDEYPPRCVNPGGHVWNRTPGEADEARLAGDSANDNVRCVYCGADGDA